MTNETAISNRKFISHYSIFDYWKDKAITKDGEVYVDYGYDGCDEEKLDNTESVGVVLDWGEPECWGCGKWISDYDYSYVDGHTLNDVYNHPSVKHELQKAHILPHALGGQETPENMFLLCEECHRDSPDTKYPREFFRWIYKKRKEGPKRVNFFKEVIAELAERGVPALCIMNDVKLGETIGSHAGLIVPDTYKAALIGAAEERWEKIKQALQEVMSVDEIACVQYRLVQSFNRSAQSFLSDQTEYVSHVNKGEQEV